jgi:hypothetical protein
MAKFNHEGSMKDWGCNKVKNLDQKAKQGE